MDAFTALQTAVSGLRSQAYSLDNISGNIANSQTTGFKRVDTSFVDLIPEQPSRQEVAGSVAAYSRLTTTLQGTVSATGVSTNMALSGPGFFAVEAKSGDSGGQPVFAGGEVYTRRGDFSLDKDGRLVNGAGYYLKGTSYDAATGQAQGSNASVIQVGNAPVPASATTTINYAANLPASPATTEAAASGSDVLAAPSTSAGFPAGYDPRVLTGSSAAGANYVAASDQQRFINQSLSGGSITAYTASGSPMDVQLRWAKVQDGNAAAGTGDVWNLFYQTSTTATGNAPAWQNAGQAFTFNASGQLDSPKGSVALSNLSVDGTALAGVGFNYGAGGLTQYASSGGLVSTTTLQQDGYASGTLTKLAITSDGKVSGTYSNGRTVALAQVAVAQFNNDDGLKREDAGTYSQTLDSGPPVTGLGAATIIGGNVEQSNTDIAEEFSKMIVTQQAYSANTKVMSTAQEMISDVLNIIR